MIYLIIFSYSFLVKRHKFSAYLHFIRAQVEASLLVLVPPLYGGDTKFCRCALSLQYGMSSSKILSQNIYSFVDIKISIGVHSNS